MLGEPKIIERGAQPYAAIGARVPMEQIASVADALPGELFGWLDARGTVPTGAPFFKYNVIDMGGQIDLEWGVPVASPVKGDSRVLSDTLPVGRYASAVHTGPYVGLRDATAALLKWVKENDLVVDAVNTPNGDKFRCRLEIYLTDPRQEPNPQKWLTEIAMRLADSR
jgi:effector-binding domain-containing protein